MGSHNQEKTRLQQLARCRLSKKICFLLLFLVIMIVIFRDYVYSIRSNGVQTYMSRSQLEHHNLKSFDTKGQTQEVSRNKTPVINEKTVLESKRLSLQTEVFSYKKQIESLRLQQQSLEKKIQQLKQEEKEHYKKYFMKVSDQVLLNDGGMKKISSIHQTGGCRMHTCFDYSRCPIIGGFPVFVYKFDQYENLNKFVKSSVSHMFEESPYVVQQPEKACVFISILGEPISEKDMDTLERTIMSLDYWNGDGRNHILLDITRNTNHVDLFKGINTGRAIIVQSSFIETLFRPNFDIVIPPNYGESYGPVWPELPPLFPVRRAYFLSFIGHLKVAVQQDKDFDKTEKNVNIENRDLNSITSFKRRALLEELGKGATEDFLVSDSSIVQNLKQSISNSQVKVFLQFVCDNNLPVGIAGEWCLCDSTSKRAEILRKSTFSIIVSPANHSIITTTVFQTRFYEALKNGAIPVIIGDNAALPFSELIEWRKAVIFHPKARVTELNFMLQTVTDNDLMQYKWHGRFFWETYFGTTSSIISTVLAVLRTRLQIPAHAVQEEPSISSITKFVPAPEEGTNKDLGPLEPPFASAKFTQNFSSQTLYDMFNRPGDPFHLYPFTPFVKVLPSEAKFKGSGYGFRSVNKGKEDPGKEFSESLGGNYPREQFTVVMLTYKRPDILIQAIIGLKGLPYLNKVIVVWNNPSPPSESLAWPDIGVPVVISYGDSQGRTVMWCIKWLTRSSKSFATCSRLKILQGRKKGWIVWELAKLLLDHERSNRYTESLICFLQVVKTKKNSLNNRFLPFEAIETEAVLSIDDDTALSQDEIIFGFRVWREERDHLVGFPGRAHAWDVEHNSWLYKIDYSCEVSMVLTGAAFFHKYYAYLYTYSMPQAIRDKVDEFMNCEDIALNFLISHITRKPPVKVNNRRNFVCANCKQSLSLAASHMDERHKCMNFFVKVYGYMPLLYTQFRAHSILYDTEIPKDN